MATVARQVTRSTAGLLTLAVLSTGCAPDGEYGISLPPPTPMSTLPPKEFLLGTLPVQQTESYRLTYKARGLTVIGQVEPASDFFKLRQVVETDTGGVTMEMLHVGGVWVKLSFEGGDDGGRPPPPDRWQQLDTRIYENDRIGLNDQGGTDISPVVRAATTVEDKGGGRYTGTVDLTAVPGAATPDDGREPVVSSDRLAVRAAARALGDRATAVPFTARVDQDRRLGSFTLDVPAAAGVEAYRISYEYSDFGTLLDTSFPLARQTEPAPEEVYGLLGL